jgi:hypothetical protein
VTDHVTKSIHQNCSPRKRVESNTHTSTNSRIFPNQVNLICDRTLISNPDNRLTAGLTDSNNFTETLDAASNNLEPSSSLRQLLEGVCDGCIARAHGSRINTARKGTRVCCLPVGLCTAAFPLICVLPYLLIDYLSLPSLMPYPDLSTSSCYQLIPSYSQH